MSEAAAVSLSVEEGLPASALPKDGASSAMQACGGRAQNGQDLSARLLRAGSTNFVREAREGAGAEALRSGFPGWGDTSVYNDVIEILPEPTQREGHLLGEFMSTAICGNDITSSCFYVVGAMAHAAGVWAPVGAIFAAVTLWLFRWVYTEAVTALPFNGGIYNILLNTLGSKKIAAIVATLTMLSYMATAVVSALSAGSYMQSLIDDSKTDPMEHGNYTVPIALLLIMFFCGLKLIGISESAAVAAVMFSVHLGVMALLAIVGLFAIALPKGILPFGLVWENLSANIQFTGGTGLSSKSNHVQEVAKRIIWGFSNAMLGVSGFESSANFVEEQKPGVFPKTLRNMWYAVTILNITFILECLFATKLEDLVQKKDMSLAFLATKVGGSWLHAVVCLDAFVVLAASILTSYVGFGGLTTRMSGDRCLPALFARSDKVATIMFMCVCISLVLILKGNSTDLAACYSFAFLTVMALFALSLVILQMERPKLPRAMKNNLLIPATSLVLVLIALVSAFIGNAETIPIFFLYCGVLVFVMLSFLYRLGLLRIIGKLVSLTRCHSLLELIGRQVDTIRRESSCVYFSKTANLCRLNKALRYVRRNENTNHCRIVHLYDQEEQIPRRLVQYAQLLDAMYPMIRVDVVFVKASFGAPIIEFLSQEWAVPPNLMFMTCPASQVPGKRIEDLRGVRVIMSHEDESIVESSEVARERIMSAASDQLFGAIADSSRPISMLLEKRLARHESWCGNDPYGASCGPSSAALSGSDPMASSACATGARGA